MCGILGYVGDKQATTILVDGLRKLEYRGYDSSGVAVISDGKLSVRRSVGKLAELEKLLEKQPVLGSLGLGHTRWATHGAPSEVNAHPHVDGTKKFVVVHNGIIENYLPLKQKLQSQGFKFRSQTDTEVVAHLIASFWQVLIKRNSKSHEEIFIESVRLALEKIKGTFALGVMCSEIPGVLIGARRDCPLIVGIGDHENFLASDVPAIIPYTRSVIFLEDGDIAVLSKDGVAVRTVEGKRVLRTVTKIDWDPAQAEKSGYEHFMLKEIHEQPHTIEDTLIGRLDHRSGLVYLDDIKLSEKFARKISRIRVVACGTSWHAGLVGAYLLEKYTGIPCQVDIASEFRYRTPVIEKRTLILAISQSGETADTLAAVRMAQEKGAHVLAITNVVGSTLTRDADSSLLTHCGPEIGVASTKAFMGQLVALNLLALWLARTRKTLPDRELRAMGRALVKLPDMVQKTLDREKQIISLARKHAKRQDFLFFGRHMNFPVALEGALKLKEISYIHAEGYPAGELKHGPIALIDDQMPVVAIVTKSKIYDKMMSNIEEVRSRGAKVIAIANDGDMAIREKTSDIFFVPEVSEDLAPMINVIPLQLLAYHIAVARGCDVDKPRNLAKSVTVE